MISLYVKNITRPLLELKKQIKPDAYYKIIEAIRLICSIELSERPKEIEYRKDDVCQ